MLQTTTGREAWLRPVKAGAQPSWLPCLACPGKRDACAPGKGYMSVKTAIVTLTAGGGVHTIRFRSPCSGKIREEPLQQEHA